MNDATVVILGCAVVTFVIKAAGPVLLGGRELPAWATAVLALLAPALLAALVVVSAFADGTELAVGPDTAGVVAGGLVYWRTGSIIGCVLAAAALTAGIRAL